MNLVFEMISFELKRRKKNIVMLIETGCSVKNKLQIACEKQQVIDLKI